MKFLDSEFAFLLTDLACRVRGSLWSCRRKQKQPGRLGGRKAPFSPLKHFLIEANGTPAFGCTLLTPAPGPAVEVPAEELNRGWLGDPRLRRRLRFGRKNKTKL